MSGISEVRNSKPEFRNKAEDPNDQLLAEAIGGSVSLPLAAVVVLVTLLRYALGRRRAFVVLGLVAGGLGALTIQWRVGDNPPHLNA